MEYFGQLFIKVLLTLVLGGIAAACGVQIWRLWLDSTPVLTPVRYTKDGAGSEERGTAFASHLVRDLRVMGQLFAPASGAEPLIPSSHQLGLGHQLSFRETGSELWSQVRFEAYGLNVSGIMQSLSRMITRPTELHAQADEGSEGVTIFAALQGAKAPLRDANWYLDRISGEQSASFSLACRLFRHRAAGSSAVFASVSDEDFEQFSVALRDYNLYRSRLLTGAEEAARQALDRADAAIAPLVRRRSPFVPAYKLAAFVKRERGDLDSLALARSYFQMYDERSDEEDELVRKAIADLEPLLAAADTDRSAATAPAATSEASVAVRPGTRVYFSSGASATIACLVRNAAGREYMVLPGFLKDDARGGAWVDADGRRADLGSFADALPDADPRLPMLFPLAGGIEASNAIDAAETQWLATLGPPPPAGAEVVIHTWTGGRKSSRVLSAHGFNDAKQVAMKAAESVPDAFLMIEPISQPGDAGAPVCTPGGVLIGMVHSSDRKSYTSVLLLKQPLEGLGLQLVGE